MSSSNDPKDATCSERRSTTWLKSRRACLDECTNSGRLPWLPWELAERLVAVVQEAEFGPLDLKLLSYELRWLDRTRELETLCVGSRKGYWASDSS
jgi:hypothetical protein